MNIYRSSQIIIMIIYSHKFTYNILQRITMQGIFGGQMLVNPPGIMEQLARNQQLHGLIFDGMNRGQRLPGPPLWEELLGGLVVSI